MTHTTLHQAVHTVRPSAAFADHIAEELRRFDEHLRDVRGGQDQTLPGACLVDRLPENAVIMRRMKCAPAKACLCLARIPAGYST